MNGIFFIIYLFVNFCVKIGEFIQIIILTPRNIFLRFLSIFNKKSGRVSIYRWRLKNHKIKPLLSLFIRKICKLITIAFFVLINRTFIFLQSMIALIVKLFHIFIVAPLRLISIKIKFFILGFVVCFIIFGVQQSYAFVTNLPSPSVIGKINYPLSTHIYDRNNKLLYEVYRDQNRTPIKLNEIPAYIYQATIAIEDKDFYHHNGISPISGMLRAIKEMIFGGKLQGGSTITQQLVKSALLTPERTLQRKFKEIILAIWTERLYSKNQILEMYLNQVPYGGSAYGIEEASRAYYGKRASDLTLSEAALLAGLPQAPSAYSPFVNPELALTRRNEVLSSMYKMGFVSKDEYQNAVKSKLVTIPSFTNIRAPHFVFYVKNTLETRYGMRQVEEGGLRVNTTLDINIQEKLQEILKEELDKVKHLNVTNGAILVTRPNTGEILAMVGSADYFASPSGAFNVTTALRQPGSSIKPVMYSLALQKGFTAASIIDDSPVVFNITGSEPYRPVNYDGRFHGKVTLRLSLANSYNIPAVRTLNALGVSEFIDYAKKMGIGTWNDPDRYGLSLTLGGGEVTMIDMARAFGVFANEGNRIDLRSVIKLEKVGGEFKEDFVSNQTKVIDDSVSYIISDILSDNTARQQAFGLNSQLEIPGYKVAVKTGTTDNKKDNWTIGYTPDYLVVVWVGNNDNQPMNPYLSSGVTGAAPIWNRTMTYLLSNNTEGNRWFVKPESVVEKSCFGRVEYFIEGTEKGIVCQMPKTSLSPTP